MICLDCHKEIPKGQEWVDVSEYWMWKKCPEKITKVYCPLCGKRRNNKIR